MKPVDNIKNSIKNLHVTPNAKTHQQRLNDILQAQENAKKTRLAKPQTNIWRIIMKSKITKLATAAVIIIAVMFGINQFGGSIDGATVAWAELVERVEQSYDEYMQKLLLAMEAKDVKKKSLFRQMH